MLLDNYLSLNVILFVSFTINTFFLEYIYKIDKDASQYLVLYNSLCSYLVASIFSLSETNYKPIPFYKYGFLSLSTFISSQTGLTALKYISMPTRILLKSCKSIPIVTLKLVTGKSIPLYKLFSIILLSSGTYIYSYSKANTDTNIGLLLAMISLFSDGIVGTYEDQLVETYGVQTFTLMKNIQLFRVLYSMILLDNWLSFYHFINNNLYTLLILGTSGSITHVCIFTSLNKYGSLSTSMMGSIRKTFNILLSVVVNNHSLSGNKLLGLTLGLSGIGVNCIRNIPFLENRISYKKII